MLKEKNGRIARGSVIGIYVGLYLLVAIISLICSIKFFALAHTGGMSWALAIAFELGQAACLISTFALPKGKRGIVWFMFILLTLFQMMGNTYAAYVALADYEGWIELFNLVEWAPLAQKRLLAIISGAILPAVALGFIECLTKYIDDPNNMIDLVPESASKTLSDIDNNISQPTEEISLDETESINEEPIKEPEQIESISEDDIEEPEQETKNEMPEPMLLTDVADNSLTMIDEKSESSIRTNQSQTSQQKTKKNGSNGSPYAGSVPFIQFK